MHEINRLIVFLTAVSFFAAASFHVVAGVFPEPSRSDAPQTWFHVIAGNVSREGLVEDMNAVSSAGISGIQFFHGDDWSKGKAWPRTRGQTPCLSAEWDGIVRFLADECEKRGILFEMQNCPGWSMSGGPWITPDKAMRKLVCFEPGDRPRFDEDDDYCEICTLTFPVELAPSNAAFTASFGSPSEMDHHWCYEPRKELVVSEEGREIFRRRCPRGGWQDGATMTFAIESMKASALKGEPGRVTFGRERKIDNWEAKAGWCLREFAMSTNRTPLAANAHKTLVFGHVNAKFRNAPAPGEATGWECDKMDASGFRANFDGYLGRLSRGVLSGGKLKGLVVDSWECGPCTWTWKMEEMFLSRNGYALRRWLPALFGYIVGSERDTERFLLDWRRTVSWLVEENYYRVISETARENGMKVQFETSFGDVVVGDPLRFWKYADIPMCEFWSPFNDANGYVGSDEFKPIRACASAAHLYGKRRVQAEAFTSFDLTWDENFKLFKRNADYQFSKGVTHLVFHTMTHQPQAGKDFRPPGTSFSGGIGSPFVRGQTWWRFMPELTRYFARCCRQLERGKPVVDVLRYLGDDVNFRPREKAEFPFGYKYDYFNRDVLFARRETTDGQIVLPDGMRYRAIWIPEGTYLEESTKRCFAALEASGVRVMRGKLSIDWPSELEKVPVRPRYWCQRREGDEDIFYLVLDDGRTFFLSVRGGKLTWYDPVSGRETAQLPPLPAKIRSLDLKPVGNYPAWATERTYAATLAGNGKPYLLTLGDVRDWAEVFVNGRKRATLWCEPYACEIGQYLKQGEKNEIRVVVTSTWYNRLVHDAALPESERKTWTLGGPKKGAPFHPAGLVD